MSVVEYNSRGRRLAGTSLLFWVAAICRLPCRVRRLLQWGRLGLYLTLHGVLQRWFFEVYSGLVGFDSGHRRLLLC